MTRKHYDYYFQGNNTTTTTNNNNIHDYDHTHGIHHKSLKGMVAGDLILQQDYEYCGCIIVRGMGMTAPLVRVVGKSESEEEEELK